ncbi:PAS domain-containing sensor histidine kinase [Hymenobacter metallicola]|uniref:histidine kinase n=1 Tax=Hymenobacter metallicola TaxID=2563114 RepID=A0A4Z0QDI2_9BACT|nr:ATP-binding protein [Hymenobacter metallicola]TGE28107.1 PAS domain-containing sensor histidine kinase [Hymenobacter metallicola]
MPLPDFFTRFIEEASQLFFVYNLDSHQVTYVNQAYHTVLGGNPAQVNAELPDLLARLHPEDIAYLRQQVQHWSQGELPEAVEFRLLRPDGSEQWLCLTPHLEQQANDPHQLGGFLTDTTASKESIANANKFNNKKNATLEILSHDLAGPFTLLEQMGDYFLEQVQPLQNARLNEMLGVMKATCADGVNLIRDFVDDEFMQSVNVELKRERVDLVEKLAFMMEEYQRSERHIAKHFVFAPAQVPIYVQLDENKFMQVMNNLLSNAIKFTHDDGVIQVGIEPLPGQVLVTVRDNGIGIADQLHPILFERFTKARRPGLRGEKTTGLGMSIIKTIVELHDGRIWFDSAENQGATFFIELPTLEG